MNSYDIIIIGGGPAGYEAAAIASQKGRKVLLVERDQLGGTCLNRGCIPTKAFCRSAEVAQAIAGAGAFGISVANRLPVSVDMAAVVSRKNAIVAGLREGVELAVAGATVVKGDAEFAGPRMIRVGDELFGADMILVATGSEAARLPIPGAELAMTSDEILEMSTLPESLVIIGAGVIGMEFASIFASFGVDVTVMEYCKEILPGFDRDIAKRLRSAMQKRGVKFILNAQVMEIAENGTTYSVGLEAKGKQQMVEAAAVLMAVGRKPCVPRGIVENAGVVVGRRGIETDDSFQTAAEGVYAVGDCNGRIMLAHAATAQARSVLGEKVDLDVVPAAVFTVPELSMVGLTEDQVVEKGHEFHIVKIPFRSNGKAQAMGETDGLLKMVVSDAAESSGRILGCHIMGSHASDLISEIALVMASGLTVADLQSTIHPHPSLSEILAAVK